MNNSFRFLVVEASFAARIVIRSQLMQLGQLVDLAITAEEMFDKIAVKTYDILLIDNHLYNSLGDYDLIAFIKKQQPHSIAPIIVITSQQPLIGNKANTTLKNLCHFYKPFSEGNALKIINYVKSTLN
ncbi:TPA: response regulator [Legionella pneumophila]|nr:response regulator [Legionella pneumophila subsp. fraseri]HAT1770895.1 response regulator [Legionella pneumophila]MDX1845058.1 response regulator [Legionella pneumophila subsp. fraseri]HAT2125768.1 response regulator [Legionella pneumophila]HAT2134804.1 response regulator [Legionella pneumophila]